MGNGNDAIVAIQVQPSAVIITVCAIIAFFLNLFSFVNLLCKRKLRANKYVRLYFACLLVI